MTEAGPHTYKGRRIAVLQAGSARGELGGAERFYGGLVAALSNAGCAVDAVNVPTDESTFDHILENYARCERLDLSQYDLVISTKAPTYAARHPNHVLYLVHSVRVFYDMFNVAFPQATQAHFDQRKAIHALDAAALGSVKCRFAIGREVANRLADWNGLDSEVLHPPLCLDGFRQGEFGDYFFLPGRLHAWKRVDLVIRAVMASKLPMKLIIAGIGEAEAELRAIARRDDRIEFLGRIADKEMLALYAGARGVPFVPLREDYGYVTLEAFASGKPVITCSDSGEPRQFVRHKRTGLVCEPTVDDLQAALEALFCDAELARTLGEAGRASTANLNWTSTVNHLLDAGFASPLLTRGMPKASKALDVAVLDMQPIDPPVGGGRIRILGLYHGMGSNIHARYVGTFDWPGERRREVALTPSLEECDVPLSDGHFAAIRDLAVRTNGKSVVDLSFPDLVHLSKDYLEEARRAISRANVVVFSHPWAFPGLADALREEHFVIYESHNVEGYLRAQMLNVSNPVEAALLRGVVKCEWAAGNRADLILACSQEDLERFVRIYGWNADKIRVVPNGAMTQQVVPATAEVRARAKAHVKLRVHRYAAIFIGSAYAPNVEAAQFIASRLAVLVPECDFIIAGGVGAEVSVPEQANVRVTGPITEAEKLVWLHASDLAVNPMFSGSGTNIKMFDFMAAGLPVVSTATGARGIPARGGKELRVVGGSPESFVEAIRGLIEDRDSLAVASSQARSRVVEDFSWERISATLGNLLLHRYRLKCRRRPFFTVIVPTLDRHQQLDALLRTLQAQSEQDFQVVIVDQSASSWPGRSAHYGFVVKYIRSDIKGAARARNEGAYFANGEVLAFTDDDCLPDRDWLSRARMRFVGSAILGLEGIVESDHAHDPNFRPVTNVGAEGLCFMTANFFVRSNAFYALGGFDVCFDRPSFREDTDFGWRLQIIGDVPFAPEVRVFHPAQPRTAEREMLSTRATFFEKDALLYQKHPKRYLDLLAIEGHWNKTEGFWEHISAGADKFGVDISALEPFRKGSRVVRRRANAS